MRKTHAAAVLALAKCVTTPATAEEPAAASPPSEAAASPSEPAPAAVATAAATPSPTSPGSEVSGAAPSETQGAEPANSEPAIPREQVPSLPPVDAKPAASPGQSKTPLFLGLRLPTFIAFGVGGLGAGGAVVTRLAASGPQPDPKLGCNSHCSDGSHTLGMTSTILAGIAGAAVGTGLVLALSEHGKRGKQLALAPVLKMSVSPSKAAASASWSF